MGASIRPALAADFFKVYELLRNSTLNSRRLPLEQRRRMFQPPWPGGRSTHGYLMEADGDVVGFLGTLFTERAIGGVMHKFCEIHSWYVKDSHRSQSLMLLMPVLSLRDVTLLNYTPTESVHDIGKKFGFGELEQELAVFYPVPSLSRLSIVDDKARIPEYLSEQDRQVFADHASVACLHLVVEDPDRPSDKPLYLIVKGMQRRWFEPFGRVLHMSDAAMFARVVRRLAWRLCLRHRWQCVLCNAADLAGQPLPRFSAVRKRPIPSQFRSRTLQAHEIRPLYSLPLLIGYELH